MTDFQTILVAAGIVVGVLLLISFSAAIELMRKIDRDLQRLRHLLAQVSRDAAVASYSRGDYAGGVQLAEQPRSDPTRHPRRTVLAVPPLLAGRTCHYVDGARLHLRIAQPVPDSDRVGEHLTRNHLVTLLQVRPRYDRMPEAKRRSTATAPASLGSGGQDRSRDESVMSGL
jgi:hypothetical protein